MGVLIVEDEVSVANSLRAGLEAEGYVVEVARDGEEGLWRASEFAFDAVVLDIMIPKLNGFVVARRLREAGRTVPILMLTAKSGEFDQTQALDTGADDPVQTVLVPGALGPPVGVDPARIDGADRSAPIG